MIGYVKNEDLEKEFISYLEKEFIYYIKKTTGLEYKNKCFDGHYVHYHFKPANIGVGNMTCKYLEKIDDDFYCKVLPFNEMVRADASPGTITIKLLSRKNIVDKITYYHIISKLLND